MRMQCFIILIVFVLAVCSCYSQQNTNISKAIKLAEDKNYLEATAVLKQELKINPGNADAYYWLGRYHHYMAYDSRPLVQKSDEWSKKQVLANLEKAIQLKPDFGDAKYFLGVEYAVRSLQALRKNDVNQAKLELKKAKDFGGMPDYVLEYARSIVNSCEKDAILFVAGDGQYNAIKYLQWFENIRADISVIAIGLLEQPFYVKMLRDGVPPLVKKVPITWNDDLIMEIHPYPWKTQEIIVPVTPGRKYNYMAPEYKSKLTIPDWEGSLWNMSAAILNMIENNKWVRPVYCALSNEEKALFILPYNLQNQGFVFELMPFYTYESPSEFDISKFESSIMNKENYKSFSDIQKNRQPRIDYFFVDNRREQILDYVRYLIIQKDYQRAKTALSKMDELMPEKIIPFSEKLNTMRKGLLTQIEKN